MLVSNSLVWIDPVMNHKYKWNDVKGHFLYSSALGEHTKEEKRINNIIIRYNKKDALLIRTPGVSPPYSIFDLWLVIEILGQIQKKTIFLCLFN